MTPAHRPRRASTTTHSKQDALSEREFELLLDGARSLGGKAVEAVAAVLACGRLGLRCGELGHLDAEWVDWTRSEIAIPEYDPCTKSDQDDACGDCRHKARQIVDYHDGALSMDDVLDTAWMPKTDAAARTVPFGFSTRTEIALERLLSEYGKWPLSVQGVYRRVTAAAEAADELDGDDVRPHGLRATAASYHAGRGLETLPLQAMFGWAQLSTAEKYVASSSENTRRALNAVHS
jgi:integrase